MNHLPQSFTSKVEEKETRPDSIYNLWSRPTGDKSEPPSVRITDPSFRNYTYRHPPPIVDCNYQRQPPQDVKNCTDLSSLPSRYHRSRRLFHYTPNIDPPLLNLSSMQHCESTKSTALEDIIDRLSLNTKTAPSNPIYNFNGDFYLKIMTLESFGRNLETIEM